MLFVAGAGFVRHTLLSGTVLGDAGIRAPDVGLGKGAEGAGIAACLASVEHAALKATISETIVQIHLVTQAMVVLLVLCHKTVCKHRSTGIR